MNPQAILYATSAACIAVLVVAPALIGYGICAWLEKRRLRKQWGARCHRRAVYNWADPALRDPLAIPGEAPCSCPICGSIDVLASGICPHCGSQAE